MERIEEAQIIKTRLKAMDIISLLIKDTVDIKAILKLAVEINEDLATLCGEKAVVNREVIKELEEQERKKQEKYEELKKIQQNFEEASIQMWNEAKQIAMNKGYSDEESDILVAIALTQLFGDGQL